MNKNYVFPKVDLKEQPRTNFDLSHKKRMSFAPCLSIPIMDIESIPTDSFYTKMQAVIESMPMVAPAMGRFKARFLFFENPLSNMYSWMDNNEKLSTQEWLSRDCHRFIYSGFSGLQDAPSTPAAGVPLGVQPGSLLNMLGLPVGFIGVDWKEDQSDMLDYDLFTNTFNAEGIITYFDIVRNYLVNNQEDSFPMICCADDSFDNYDEKANPIIKYYSLSVLDDWIRILRQQPNGVDNIFDKQAYVNIPFDGELIDFLRDLRRSHLVPSGGLVCTPYLMDFNRGIMNASVGDTQAQVSVTTTDEELMQFAIPQLRFANKMQNLIDRLDLSGGRWADVLSTVWRARVKGSIDRPIFVGSRSQWIYMQDIISTATTGDSSDPSASQLGQQGGFVSGRTSDEKKAVTNFDFQEYGRFMCIFQLIPDVDYSAGIDLQLMKRSFSDKYIPQYAQIGWQDVSNYELSALPSSYNSVVGAYYPNRNVDGAPYKVGVRVAWSEYTCQLDRVYGDFAQGGKLDYWVLLRRYRLHQDSFGEVNLPETYVNFTTYAYPYLFNYLFVDQALATHNFRLQIAFDIKAKRPLPRRSMPRL